MRGSNDQPTPPSLVAVAWLPLKGGRQVAASQMLEGGNSDLISVADFKSLAS